MSRNARRNMINASEHLVDDEEYNHEKLKIKARNNYPATSAKYAWWWDPSYPSDIVCWKRYRKTQYRVKNKAKKSSQRYSQQKQARDRGIADWEKQHIAHVMYTRADYRNMYYKRLLRQYKDNPNYVVVKHGAFDWPEAQFIPDKYATRRHHKTKASNDPWFRKFSWPARH